MTRPATLATLLLPCFASAKHPGGMDFCMSFAHVCGATTNKLACRSAFDSSPSKRVVAMTACQSNKYDAFIGQCVCAGLDAGRSTLTSVVDYSVQDALPQLILAARHGENTVDFGEVYNKACQTFLSGSGCPTSLSINEAYTLSSAGQCSCGSIDASDSIRDAIISYLIKQKLPSQALPAATPLNLCQTFTGSCRSLLSNIGCSAPTQILVGGCSGTPDSLTSECTCGKVDASEALMATLVEYAAANDISAEWVYTGIAGAQVDMCHTYGNVCSNLLQKSNVTAATAISDPNCVGSSGTNLATFRPICGSSAGSLDLSPYITDFILQNVVQSTMPTLVCLGNECAGVGSSPGLMAIIIISVVLLGIALLTYAYNRGDMWARAIVSSPLVNRLLMPFYQFAQGRRHGSGTVGRNELAPKHKDSPKEEEYEGGMRAAMA